MRQSDYEGDLLFMIIAVIFLLKINADVKRNTTLTTAQRELDENENLLNNIIETTWPPVRLITY